MKLKANTLRKAEQCQQMGKQNAVPIHPCQKEVASEVYERP